MFSDLTSRRLVALTLVGACALGLVACGDDKTDTKADTTTTTTTTTSAGDTTSTTPDGSTPKDSSAPGSTVPKLAFDDGVAKLKDSIDAAKGDTCKLYAVVSSEVNIQNPSTPDEVHAAIDVTAQLFTAIADAAPADQADAKAKINSGVEFMNSTLAAASYSVEEFNKRDYFNQDLETGMKAFTTTASTNCK